jgi:hypothetical protein
MKKVFRKSFQTLYNYFTEFSVRKYLTTSLICVSMLLAVYFFALDDVFANVLSVVLGLAVSSILFNVLRAILASYEDELKVCCEDSVLTKIYTTGKYVKELTFINSKTSFLYEASYVSCPGDVIEIVDNPNKQFAVNSLIESNLFELLKAHHHSYFRNCPTVRLDDFTYDNDNQKLTLNTSRSNFLNHLITNRCVDFKLHRSISLRHIYEGGYELNKLNDSVFSNHIGINALVFLDDDYLVLPHRGMKSTISKNMITSSVATRLLMDDYSQNLSADFLTGSNLRIFLTRDLFFPDDVVHNCKIDFLGFGQNIYEGGKPQFYFSIKVNFAKESYRKILDEKFQRKSHKIDENKRYYLADSKTLYADKNKIGFQHYAKSGEHKDACIAPEKSFLANLWHWKQNNATRETPTNSNSLIQVDLTTKVLESVT